MFLKLIILWLILAFLAWAFIRGGTRKKTPTK